MTSSEFRVVPPSLRMWETFYHPRRFFCAHWQPLPVPAPCSRPPPPRSMQQPTFVFFLSSSLFWTSHMNGIIQYVIFCICLSLSIMFLRFISVPFMGIGSDGKESACNEGDLGLIPGSGRSLGEGNGNPLQYSCLENPWTKEPGGSSLWGRKESDKTEQLSKFHSMDIARFVHSLNSWWGFVHCICLSVCFHFSGVIYLGVEMLNHMVNIFLTF